MFVVSCKRKHFFLKQCRSVTECMGHVCLHMYVCYQCMCVLDRERSLVFSSAALVVIQTAMYLTSYTYNDYLTGLHEPLSPPYRCHASSKNVQLKHWECQEMIDASSIPFKTGCFISSANYLSTFDQFIATSCSLINIKIDSMHAFRVVLVAGLRIGI